MGNPLDADSCNVFKISSYLLAPNELAELKIKYESGDIGFGHAKMALLDTFKDKFSQPQERFNAFLANPKELDQKLKNVLYH